MKSLLRLHILLIFILCFSGCAKVTARDKLEIQADKFVELLNDRKTWKEAYEFYSTERKAVMTQSYFTRQLFKQYDEMDVREYRIVFVEIDKKDPNKAFVWIAIVSEKDGKTRVENVKTPWVLEEGEWHCAHVSHPRQT
jgi:hypothetical protein